MGPSLKTAYITKRAYEIVNSVKFDPGKANLHGAEMEKHISDMSKDAFNEYLQPEIDELGLPNFLTQSVSNKAISIISNKIKEKYINNVV